MATIFKQVDTTDLAYIQKISRITVDHSYRSFLNDKVVDHYLRNGHLDTYLAANIENTRALYLDNNIIGYSICIENVIDFMLIDINYHRQGFGKKLLRDSEELLFANHKVIALESFEKNINASKFYNANHWEETNKFNDSKSNATKIIFRKHLTSSM